tara:strand:+ start:1012 stop:1284 length:273 start_codon:yes stop_codon:yes gene_type:complete
MDFKRKEAKKTEIQPDGHIEQRIVDMAEKYPEVSLTGLVHRLSRSAIVTDKIAAVGIKYAVKVISKIITESADQNEFSDGDIIDQIYDEL